MVKKFAGQVKVADVQAAFDEVVGRVNYLVDSYNGQAFVKDIDYTVGGTTLAPAGYTLTTGGYKQFLNACEGCVVGCKPIRTDDNHFKVTAGMLVARNGIHKLPDSVLPIPTDKTLRSLYYNPYTKAYQWTGSGTISYLRTKEVTLGSNLEPVSSEKPNSYVLNEQGTEDYSTEGSWGKVYAADSTGTTSFSANPRLYTTMHKIPKGVPLKEDRLQLTINDYCYIPVEDSFNYDTEISLDFSKDHPRIDARWYGDEGATLLFGVLETDGVTFIPKFNILFAGGSDSTGFGIYTIRYINHETYSYYSGQPPIIHEAAILHSWINADSYISLSENVVSNNTKLNLTFEIGADGDYLVVSKLVDGEYVRDGVCKLPQTLKDYGINTMFLLNCANRNPESGSAFYPLDKDFAVITQNSKENRIVTESRKVTITELVTEESDTAAYRVCDINTECSSNYIGTVHNVLSEKISGKLNIYSQDKDYTTPENYIRVQRDGGTSCYNALDTSKAAKFVSALTADVSSDNSGGNDISLFGTKVCHVGHQGSGRGEYYFPMTFLYVPKGVSNPYTYYDSWRDTTNPNASCQKVLNVIIDKNIEDKSG